MSFRLRLPDVSFTEIVIALEKGSTLAIDSSTSPPSWAYRHEEASCILQTRRPKHSLI